MSNTPPEQPNLNLKSPMIAGAVLAMLGIVLFLVIYAALANSEPIARLFIALCVPPVIIAAIVGGYGWFIKRGRS